MTTTESQGRASLDVPSGGLITQFDVHLRIIGDRYLNFFLERRADLPCDPHIALIISITGEGLKKSSQLSSQHLPLSL